MHMHPALPADVCLRSGSGSSSYSMLRKTSKDCFREKQSFHATHMVY